MNIRCTLNTNIPDSLLKELLPKGVKLCHVVSQEVHLTEIPPDFNGLIMDDRDEDDLRLLLDSRSAQYISTIGRYLAKRTELSSHFPAATIGEYQVSTPAHGTLEEVLEVNRWFAPVLHGLPISMMPLYIAEPGGLDYIPNSLTAGLMLHPRYAPILCPFYMGPDNKGTPLSPRDKKNLLGMVGGAKVKVYGQTRRVNDVIIWMADEVQRLNNDLLTNKKHIRSTVTEFAAAMRKVAA